MQSTFVESLQRQKQRLHTENEHLKAQLEAAQAENAQLRAELAEFKAEARERELLNGLDQNLLRRCDELELSNHTWRCLARYNAQYIWQIAIKTRAELEASGLFTFRALNEIERVLGELGIELETPIPAEVRDLLPEPTKLPLTTELAVLCGNGILDERSYNALCRNGPMLETAGQLVQCNSKLLLKATYFGRESLKLVEGVARHVFGYRLGTELEPELAAQFPLEGPWFARHGSR